MATDAHKWLNVPYDSGLVFVAIPRPTGPLATVVTWPRGGTGERDPDAYTPGFAALGLPGGRRCACWAAPAWPSWSSAAAATPAASPTCWGADGVEVLNEVVLNQVLVRFTDPGGDSDGRTRGVIRRVQEDGTLWLSGTTWHGLAAMRISVSNWSTTTDDAPTARRRDPGRRPARPYEEGRCHPTTCWGSTSTTTWPARRPGSSWPRSSATRIQGSELGNTMEAVHRDIAQDRDPGGADGPPGGGAAPGQEAAGWALEKLSRLRLNPALTGGADLTRGCWRPRPCRWASRASWPCGWPSSRRPTPGDPRLAGTTSTG